MGFWVLFILDILKIPLEVDLETFSCLHLIDRSFFRGTAACKANWNILCSHRLILGFKPQFIPPILLHLLSAIVALSAAFWTYDFQVSFWLKMAPRYFTSLEKGISWPFYQCFIYQWFQPFVDPFPSKWNDHCLIWVSSLHQFSTILSAIWLLPERVLPNLPRTTIVKSSTYPRQ